MPRFAGLRHILPVLALTALSVGGCSSHGGSADGGAPAVVDMSPVPAPAGHLGDLYLSAPGATWSKARGLVGGAALFLPQGFSALTTTLAGLPITFSGEIDDAVPVVGAAARQGQGPVTFAIGVHVKAGDRFVDQLTRGEAARFNAAVDPTTHVTLLTDKVEAGSRKLALGVLGNYLLMARQPADLYALGPYVVRTLGPAPAPKEDVAIEIPEKALAGPVLDEVRALRGRAEGAAAALVPLAEILDTAATVFADSTRARAVLSFDPSVVHGRVTVTPKPGGGPASKVVADLAVGDVKPLLDLPESTSLGLLWRESGTARVDNAGKQADALARLLGGDVTEEERSSITSALRATAEARGDWQALGVAFNGTGPSTVVRTPVTGADKMKKALKQLVDLGGLASFKKVLGGLGFKLAVDKAVVENMAADVTRVRLSRADAEAKPAQGKAEKKPGAPAPETPKAIDLLYFVDDAGLFAAGGYDPKDSLRALAKGPAGPTLAGNPLMSGALADIGGDVAFVVVADAMHINAMTSGAAPPPAQAPMVLAAGRAAQPAELWARLDVPNVVVQQLVQELLRRRGAP